MNPVEIVLVVVAVAGVAFGINAYYHLWKWARDCQQAAIAIAYKRKVAASPTLVELLLWSRKVPKDQNGQVFYKGPNVTVAVIKRPTRNWRQRRQIQKNQAPRAQSKFGTWSMKQDEERQAS